MMLNAGFGYRSLPLLGIAATIVAAAVAFLSDLRERRAGTAPPMAVARAEQPYAV